MYEEKNMSLTSDGRKVYEAVLTALFPDHPYGTQTVLGTQENPVSYTHLTIAAPAGVVLVAIEGEDAVKAIVK